MAQKERCPRTSCISKMWRQFISYLICLHVNSRFTQSSSYQILQPCWNVHSFVPVECTHWQTEFVLDLHIYTYLPTDNLYLVVWCSPLLLCCSPWLYHRSSISTQLKYHEYCNWLWLSENQPTLHGHLDFWPFGLLDFWSSRFLAFRTSGLLDFWTSRLLVFRTSSLQASGLLFFRTSGLLDF